jgi:hypothetical protein
MVERGGHGRGGSGVSGAGAPQGGVISPLLSNICLHEVLDRRFKETVQPGMKGKAFMVGYADDAVIGYELAEDAGRVMKVLALRFAGYGLTSDFSPLHPEKTRLIAFTEPGKGREVLPFRGLSATG